MGERCDFFEEISTKRADWIIKVYVVRMWYGPPRPNSSEAGALEIALHDLKQDTLHDSKISGVTVPAHSVGGAAI
ncbi:hypothetical protein Ahy_A03g012205 [Arachis hypogaea]|uniref:Uncharacterized protein n=1 Tax=Arachis hypogaea TaxID=3818 RepID=A0A445DSR6_ARAHY|nr:hypothetical protein Ahy_A03g012205 [Arachis hypogaea]